MKAKVLQLLLLFMLFTQSALSQNDYYVTTIPDAEITALCDDGDYIWVGTDCGLTKLQKSTSEIVSFYCEKDYGLYNSRISALAIDSLGTLYLGTSGDGMVMFDGTEWKVYNVSNSSLPHNRVNVLEFDSHGSLWIGTSFGLARFDGNEWNVYQTLTSDIPFNIIADIAFDRQGCLWITSGSSSVGQFDGENWTKHNRESSGLVLPSDNINLVVSDINGNIWIGTLTSLIKFNGESWTIYRGEDFGLKINTIDVLASDAQGNVWIANMTGLSQFDGVSYSVYTSENSGLPKRTYSSLIIDFSGSVWIGTDAGLVMFDGMNWKEYNTGKIGGPDTWTRKTDMPTRRSDLATCVVDGKIYAIGGKIDMKFPIMGSGPYSRVEVYDPETDTWTEKSAMPTVRWGLSLSVLNGKIYAIGGNNTFYDSYSLSGDVEYVLPGLTTVEEYDPATDTWTTKADMPTGRFYPSTTVIDGKIYVIGGSEKYDLQLWVHIPLAKVEVYDPVTDSWTTKGDMLQTEMVYTSSAANGKIYAFGPSTVDEYDPETDSWTIKADIPLNMHDPESCEVNGKIYLIGNLTGGGVGGGNINISNTVLPTLEYDPVTNTFAEKTTMPSGRMQYSACTFNGKIFVIGGLYLNRFGLWGCTSVSTVYVYDTGFRPEQTVVESVPYMFNIVRNYPNPFNPSTTINYRLDKVGMVNLVIYDLLGRKVATLVDEVKTPGEHSVIWNADGFASGVYFYWLELGDSKVLTQKMMLMK